MAPWRGFNQLGISTTTTRFSLSAPYVPQTGFVGGEATRGFARLVRGAANLSGYGPDVSDEERIFTFLADSVSISLAATGIGIAAAGAVQALKYSVRGLVLLTKSTARLFKRLRRPQSVGAARTLKFESSPKHSIFNRIGNKGKISRAPTDGQGALNTSVQVSRNSTRRVGVDYKNNQFVVFDETIEGIFHGHVRTWKDLNRAMQNALTNSGMVGRTGKILGGN